MEATPSWPLSLPPSFPPLAPRSLCSSRHHPLRLSVSAPSSHRRLFHAYLRWSSLPSAEPLIASRSHRSSLSSVMPLSPISQAPCQSAKPLIRQGTHQSSLSATSLSRVCSLPTRFLVYQSLVGSASRPPGLSSISLSSTTLSSTTFVGSASQPTVSHQQELPGSTYCHRQNLPVCPHLCVCSSVCCIIVSVCVSTSSVHVLGAVYHSF